MSVPRRSTSAPARPSGPRAPRAVGLLLLAAAVVAAVVLDASPAQAQQRRIVVVGDSVILGAESAMVGAFTNLGWAVTFDAAVSRSTPAGAAAIESHWPELTDTLVVNLGANDAGNTGVFRQRVEQILSAASGVPHVYWLTIREVRDYYPAANQALREVAAGYPNVTVLDWNAASAGEGLTSGDGLHLTGAGAAAMTDLVVSAALGATPPVAAVPPPTEPAPTAPPATELPPVTEPPPTTEVPTTLAPTTSTTGSTTTTLFTTRSAGPSPDRPVPVAAVEIDAPGWSASEALALVVVALALCAAGVGGWALHATRERAASTSPRPADTVAPPPAEQEADDLQ